jgi:hypothetical protein
MGGRIGSESLPLCGKSRLFFAEKRISGKLSHVKQRPDFLKRHTLFSSICFLLTMETGGHILWLRGVIPDNNAGGEILYFYVPLAWVVITILLVGRKFS